jgi:uncharacterized protein
VNKRLVLRKTAEFVKKKLENDSSGHDWWHIYRVWKMSNRLARSERKADLFVVQLAALLHDVADWKFYSEHAGQATARKWLVGLNVPEEDVTHICHIVDEVSFKGAHVKNKINTIEGMIVQDADRLDALGAIGIARTFAFGGSRGRKMYEPDKKAKMHKSFEEYKKSNSNSINHFYEKLLLLKDKMNTKAAKKIAVKRHKIMEQYLKEFFREWNAR